MLGVGLREHHQLDIGRITPQCGKALGQIVDLVGGERQAQFGIGLLPAPIGPPTSKRNPRRAARFGLHEQALSLGRIAQHDLGHAIVQQRCRARERGFVEAALVRETSAVRR